MTSTSSGTDDVHETTGEPDGGLAEALVEALALDAETEEFAQQIADQVASFLLALRGGEQAYGHA